MNFDESDNYQDNKNPLCVFRISPTLSIQLLNRPTILSPSRLTSTKRRSGVCSKIQIKPRFKRKSRRFSHKLAKYLIGHVTTTTKETLSLNEVLDTLKQVWISPNSQLKSNHFINKDMNEEIKKGSNTSSEVSSPIILRRRLSAPETIMRKHMLAQQRLDDSDGTQISETNSFHWRTDIGSSDQNLYKKKDAGIRKSTLLRRLWSNNKPLSEKRSRLIGGYYDWNYSTIKVFPDKYSRSVSSAHSSPEHKRIINRRIFNEESLASSLSRNNKISSKYNFENNNVISPKKQQINKNLELMNNSQKSISCGKSIYDNEMDYKFAINAANVSKLTSEIECEHYSARSAEDNTSTTSYATYSDNCDSAFTYSKMSNTTPSTCETCENNNKDLHTTTNEITRKRTEGKISNSNSTSTTDDYKYGKSAAINESTQTNDVTNLNIISNVQLSQSTINSIFNHVLNDLQEDTTKQRIEVSSSISSDSNSNNTVNSKLIKVQEVPSFYLKTSTDNPADIGSDQSRILKYMISNVGTGSNYGKPAEVPQIIVPRYSALPRTSSMEVNTSSGDCTDKESDTLSLVDSLEDPTSPRVNEKLNEHDAKLVRGDVSPLLLPDNSKKRKRLKPATFYVPIETDAETEVKPVAEHLPPKVKEKLWKRQLKREEKLAKTKSTIFDTVNNHSVMVITNDCNENNTIRHLSDVNSNRSKFKSKTVLPSIDRNYKYRINRDKIKPQIEEKMKDLNKSVKRKSVFVSQGQLSDSYKCKAKSGPHLSLRMRHKPEKLTPIYTTRNESLHENLLKKTCNQNEIDNKRIEILEIVECIQTSSIQNTQTLKNKSKIPILVKSKNSKTQQNFVKPCYLDFEQTQASDPKIDHLIANILIDSLHINQAEHSSRTDVTFQSKSHPKSSETFLQMKHSSQQTKKKFDSIPEEQPSLGSSKCNSFEENVSDKNQENAEVKNINIKQTDDALLKQNEGEPPVPCEKAPVALNKNENASTMPKGWITFYMLHKHQGSPDSTSDEGANNNENDEKNPNQVQEEINNEIRSESIPPKTKISHHHQRIKQLKIKSSNYSVPDINKNHQSSNSDLMSSTESDQYHSHTPCKIRNRKKVSQNSTRHKSTSKTENSKNVNNQWSVTVSSSNNYGQFVPDLEMRLKFPNNNNNNQGNVNNQSHDNSLFAHDDFDTKTATTLPSLPNKQEYKTHMEPVYTRSSTKLPEIKNTNLKKRSESSVAPVGIMLPAKMEPRQTRTSSRRYYLNRQYSYPRSYDSEDIIALREENRQLCEILKRLPTLLKVTGNAISPERKPRVTTMTERDLTRNLYINQQQ